MWARDNATMAVIDCGPGPLMGTELSVILNVMAARRYIITAESIPSKESLNEIDFRLKVKPTTNATSTALKLKMAMTPNVPLKLNVLLIVAYNIATV